MVMTFIIAHGMAQVVRHTTSPYSRSDYNPIKTMWSKVKALGAGGGSADVLV